jgi:predicted transport protein
MSDIKLFKINGKVSELVGKSVALEKSLQTLLERDLETFLGVRFLASEYPTGRTHKGRIDTLGMDENGCPVIIEYKRSTNENVINQGLFYLDWLLDHKAEFEMLVLGKVDKQAKDAIEWTTPRLICIAGDFTRYDEHAVQQINRNIELIRYKKFEDELLLLELVNAVTANEPAEQKSGSGKKTKTVSDYLAQAGSAQRDRYLALEAFAMSLGDDVQKKTLKYYFAFKRIKNFACVEIHTQTGNIMVYLKGASRDIVFEEGFSRDVTNIGHFGTGNLEITIRNDTDLERAKYLIEQSYEIS